MSKQKKPKGTPKKLDREQPKAITSFMKENVQLMLGLIATTSFLASVILLALIFVAWQSDTTTIAKIFTTVASSLFGTLFVLYGIKGVKAYRAIDELMDYDILSNMFPSLVSLIALIVSLIALFK